MDDRACRARVLHVQGGVMNRLSEPPPAREQSGSHELPVGYLRGRAVGELIIIERSWYPRTGSAAS